MTSKFIDCSNIPPHLKNTVLEINQRLAGIKYCFMGSIAMSAYGCLCGLRSLPDVSYKDLAKFFYNKCNNGRGFGEINVDDGNTKIVDSTPNTIYHRIVSDIDLLVDFQDFMSITVRMKVLGFKFGCLGHLSYPPMERGILSKTSISMFRGDISVDLVNQRSLLNQIFTKPDAIFNFEIPLLKPEYLKQNKIASFNERMELKDLYDIWFYDQIEQCLNKI